MTKKLIALLLCLTMVAALLTGCNTSPIGQYEGKDPQTTEEPVAEPDGTEESADAEEPVEEDENDAEDSGEPEDEPEAVADEGEEEPAEPTPTPVPGLGPEAYDPDTVVATYNGIDVTWREYYYWLSYYVEYTQYLQMMGLFTFTGWDSNDVSATYDNAEVIRVSAWGGLSQYLAIESMANDLGVTLDEADQAEILATFEQNADSLGDGDGECTEDEAAAFEDYLAEQFVDRAQFDHMTEDVLLYEKVYTALYGEDGADYPDEDVQAYADEQNMLFCKHILILSIDQTTGEALPEEELAQREEKINDLYEQLAAVADDREALLALFDELMYANSEDTGLIMYPDGYLFTPNTMVAEFEDTTAALEEYGLSEPVQSSYGWHIILRLPVDPDQAVTGNDGSASTLRRNAADQDFYERITQTTENAEVIWNDGFDPIDIAEIFGEAL